MVGSIRDVTESFASQARLTEQNQLLQSIIDSVPARVYWVDGKGVYQGANDLFLKDAELEDQAALIGKKDQDLIWSATYGEDYRKDDLEVLTSGLSKLFVEYDEVDRQGNRVVWRSSRVVMRDEADQITGLLCMYEDVTERRQNEETLQEQKNRLYYQANHDTLTHLPNRCLFQFRLNEAILEGHKKGLKFSLLFIDLDQFKKINDSWGHHVGDRVLQEIARRLKGHIRPLDTLARLGGDEFTILLRSITSSAALSEFVQNILTDIKRVIVVEGESFYLSCSIGMSRYPNDSLVAEELLKFADTAMYRAKDQGRNNAQFYTEEMTHAAFEHVLMQSSLNQALANKEFIVYYQPKVNARTNEVIGMEALVRWQHPRLGLVPPNQFIPLAEEIGLIVELDRMVMTEAMHQVSQWYKAGLSPGVLSLNLSPKQLKQPDFLDFIVSSLEESDALAEWFELEITENELMKNLKEMQFKLEKIQALGIQISIDDFGTGYSSLAYLKRLPIKKLKIDRAFIKDLPEDDDDCVITSTIILMAHNLGLEVIAEGVETLEQKAFLLAHNCECIQGWLYSRPVPAIEMEAYLMQAHLAGARTL
ncbi:MAG: EAL domain-containing protein [Gammaproteobacteria bacterium]|nr:EAL domain-containing protein [Gammaproteobacteria bacterium]